MFITAHADRRIRERCRFVRPGRGIAVLEALEGTPGEHGTVAYVKHLPSMVKTDDGSNGNVLVAIAVEGSVETVYFRRHTQSLDPVWFGARKVVTLE